MRDHQKFMRSCVSRAAIMAILAIAICGSVLAKNTHMQPVTVQLTNASKQQVCINGSQKTTCVIAGASKTILVDPTHYYMTDGLVTLTLGAGNQQATLYGIFRPDVTTAHIRINYDAIHNVSIDYPDRDFTPGSFVYSDKKSFLQFVAVEQGLLD